MAFAQTDRNGGLYGKRCETENIYKVLTMPGAWCTIMIRR